MKRLTDREITGRLESWWYDELNHVLWGNLYEDTKGRWWDGAQIHTSVLSMPRNPDLSEGMIIKTRNSTYLLGEKYV